MLKFLNFIVTIALITIVLLFCFNVISLISLKLSIPALLFLLFIINFIFYRNKLIKIETDNPLKIKTKRAAIFFYIFLIVSLFIMIIALIFGKTMPHTYVKATIVSLCLSLFCTLFFGYQFESYSFWGKKTFSEVRSFGLAINPHHILGKLFYGLIFLFIIFVLLASIFIGPTH